VGFEMDEGWVQRAAHLAGCCAQDRLHHPLESLSLPLLGAPTEMPWVPAHSLLHLQAHPRHLTQEG
jgi:hypothetical protein